MSKETFTSPKGRLGFSALTTPSTKFNEDGEYVAQLVVSPEEGEQLLEQFITLQDEAVSIAVEKARQKGRTLKPEKVKRTGLPVKPYETQEGEETGEYVVTFKRKAGGVTKEGAPWKYCLPLWDSQGKRITDTSSLQVWGGSVVRISYTAEPFYNDSLGAGVSVRIKAVQILKLVSGEASFESNGFEAEEDGFSVDEISSGASAGGGVDEDEGFVGADDVDGDDVPF